MVLYPFSKLREFKSSCNGSRLINSRCEWSLYTHSLIGRYITDYGVNNWKVKPFLGHPTQVRRINLLVARNGKVKTHLQKKIESKVTLLMNVDFDKQTDMDEINLHENCADYSSFCIILTPTQQHLKKLDQGLNQNHLLNCQPL